MKEHLGKFDATGLAFAKEALEAAGIEYVVRDDSPGSRYSASMGRMADVPASYDLLVEAERLADAKAALERWEKEAEAAALRESGAPLPDPEELAADAEWERQKTRDEARRARPIWPGLIILAAVGAVIALVLASR